MSKLNLKTILNSNGSITAQWSAVSGAERYSVDIHVPGSGVATHYEKNFKGTSFTSKANLAANKKYQVIIVAYGNNKSLDSESSTILIRSDFYTSQPPAVPENVSAISDTISVTVSYSKADRATGYDILFDGTVNHVTGLSKKFTGLTPNTNHTYAVRAVNAKYQSSYSAKKSIKTLPKTPAVPSGIKKSVTQNTATISWSKVSDATSYDIVFNGKTYNVTSTSKTFSKLSACKSYNFKIRAKNSGASSAYTSDMTVVTAPTVPKGVSAASTGTTVTVNWNALADVTGYIVKFNGMEYHASADETSDTFTGLKYETTYTYQVCGKSADGVGNYSKEQTIKTLSGKPVVPTDIVRESTENSVTIGWERVNDATGYDVLFDGKTYAVTETSKTVTGLKDNTTYSYQVRAKNNVGAGEYSAVQKVKTSPKAPSGSNAVMNEETITISWNAVTGAKSYDVLFNGTVYNVTATSKKITGLKPNTSYTYQIRVHNEDGVSSYGSSKTVKTAPDRPEAETAAVTDNAVTISWKAVAGAISYNIKFNGKEYSVIGTTKTFTELKPNTSYKYAVQSNNVEASSSYSEEKTVKTALGIPQSITATATTNKVTIKWKAVSGANGYEVIFNGVTYKVSSTSKAISGLESNQSYSYRVRAKDATRTGEYSAWNTVQTKLAVPAVPKNIKASATADTITIQWDAVKYAESYDVKWNNVTYNTTSASKEFTSLSSNTSYQYAVRAKNTAGNSAFSAAKKVRTLLPVPVISNVVATGDSIIISWDKVAGAKKYDVMFNGKVYTITGTTKKFTGLEQETSYTVSLNAKNNYVESGYGEGKTITTMRLRPAVPCNINAESTLDTVIVSWDAVENASSYDIKFDGESTPVTVAAAGPVRTLYGNTIEIALPVVPVDNTDGSNGGRITRDFRNLLPNTEHTYCVRANNQYGSSDYSELMNIRTQTGQKSSLPVTNQKQSYPDGRLANTELDPVNAVTGAFLWSYPCLSDYGKDALNFTMMYNSMQYMRTKVLGQKWTYSLNYTLFMDDTYAYFGTPQGDMIPFCKENGNFRLLKGMPDGYSMQKEEDGYLIRDSGGTEYIFNENLSLNKIKKNGLTRYQFLSDQEGRIIGITGQYGAKLTLGYDKGRISSVSNLAGDMVCFTYQGDDLAGVINAEGKTMSFSYTNEGYLMEINDFAGNPYLTNNYDMYGRVILQRIAGQGESIVAYDPLNRVTTFVDALRHTTKYRYDENFSVTSIEMEESGIRRTFNESGQMTEQTDALGHVTKMSYDENGRMNMVVHPDGSKEQIVYNDRNLPVTIINRDKTESRYSYDDRGNLISAQDERGNVCSYQYDDKDNLISYTDKEGNVWLYAYDEHNHLQETTDPEGNHCQYVHDAAGRLLSYTTAMGRETAYQYSETGDLLSITNAEGSILMEYDANGNRTAITDRNGNRRCFVYNEMGQISKAEDGKGNVSLYRYDVLGRLIQEKDPLGYDTDYAYDAFGNVELVTDKNGSATQYTYDAVHQLTEVTDALGGTVKYVYDNMGQIQSITNPLEHQTVYQYDKTGHILCVTNALGHHVKYTYDAVGNLLTKTDEEGTVTAYRYDKENRLAAIETEAGITSFTYDRLGRVVSVQDVNGHVETAQYDMDDHMVSAADKEKHVTAYLYDDAGRLIELTAPNGGKTSYCYDRNGNCTSVTDAENHTYSYEYDANDRLVKITDALGQETVCEYDARGKVRAITDARGNTTTYEYDGNGNLVKETNPLSGSKTYTYDALNRLVEKTDEEGYRSAYQYDAAGNMISYTDANQNTWTYSYDAVNRLNSVTDQEGSVLAFGYSDGGRMTEVTDAEGARTSYEYDSLGRLLKMSDALEHSIRLTYDGMGRVLTRTDANGNVTEYEYSPKGNLLCVKRPEGDSTTYTYNALGQILTETDALGNSIAYEYDLLGQVQTITDAVGAKLKFTYTAGGQVETVTNMNGEVTKYYYDPCGNLVKVTDPLGHTVHFEYDAMNNQIKEYQSEGEQPLCITLYQYDKKKQRIKKINPLQDEQTYTYDGNGNYEKITDEEKKQLQVRYNLNNQPVEFQYSDGKKAMFRYNKRGELVEIQDWNGTASLEHDPVGRLIKVTDHNGRDVQYSYDACGNITGITYPDGSKVDYAYDKNNRLTKVTDADMQEICYAYDAVGNITSVTQPGSSAAYAYAATRLPLQAEYRLNDGTAMTEKFGYDAMGRIISAERSGSTSELTRSVAYAYDAIGQLVSCKTGQMTEDYRYDALGNRTVRLVDGVEKGTYQYNAMNQLISMTVNSIQYGYGYDKCGNLTAERRGDELVCRYTYDGANHMVLGINEETGEQSEYEYNALSMRVRHAQTTYVPDYLSRPHHDLMSYGVGSCVARNVFGKGYDLLSRKITTEAEYHETASAGSGSTAETIGKIYFQPDLYGSPLFTLNEQGKMLSYAERNIWGEPQYSAQDGYGIAAAGGFNFTSYVYDPVIHKYFAHARFYDSIQGRMLSPDPVKRGMNPYVYCNNDPVDYVDPTGEIFHVAAATAASAATGFTLNFIGSAVDQFVNGKDVNWRQALGAGVNGAVVYGTKGLEVSSGIGMLGSTGLDFGAGALGDALEQWIVNGDVDPRKAVQSGATNAVSNLFTGNPVNTVKDAFTHGLKEGMATAAVDELFNLFDDGRTGKTVPGVKLPYQTKRDPRSQCTGSNPVKPSLGYAEADGYCYDDGGSGFNLGESLKNIAFRGVTNGLSNAVGFKAGKALEALENSGRGRRKSGSKTDFYVTPNGDVVPATGYRYMDSGRANDAMTSGEQYTTYIGFKKYDSASQVKDAFQIADSWSDCKVRGEFDTLQVIDDLYVPTTKGNTTTIPEPITFSYPEYGRGGEHQLRVDKVVKFLNVDFIGEEK